MRLLQLTWLLPIVLAYAGYVSANLDVIYEWKYIDYCWKNDEQKQKAIDNGEYDHTTIYPTDFQALKGGEDLIMTPRFSNNPASVSTISNRTGDGGPLLCPWPDWSWHTKKDCSGITSVSRVFLDDHGKLWLVDSGKVGNEQVCPAKIMKFDSETKKLLFETPIPSNLTHNPNDESKGRLELQLVEMSDDSDGEFWAYISDIDGYGLLIFDGTDIWRLDGKPFYPTSIGKEFSINGVNFTLEAGSSSLLLNPAGFLEQSYLIMKPLSSLRTYMIPTEQLHKSKSGSGVDFYISNFIAPSQEPGKAFTKKNGLLVTSFTTETAMACWNLQNPLTDNNTAVLETNSTTLQYVTSAKITAEDESGIEILSLLSNRLQKIITKSMNFEEINFRVLQVDVNLFAAGTVCEPKEHEVADGIEKKNFQYEMTIYNKMAED